MGYVRNAVDLENTWLSIILGFAAMARDSHDYEEVSFKHIHKDLIDVCGLLYEIYEEARPYLGPELENELLDNYSQVIVYGTSSQT